MQRRAVLIGMGATLFLAGCESRLNPVNWFGNSREEPVQARTSAQGEGGYVPPSDGRRRIATVTDLDVERVPGGALITATGLPLTQGFWDPALLPMDYDEVGEPIGVNGTFRLEFRHKLPPVRNPQGTQDSREMTAAIFVTDQNLEGVRTITVIGTENQRSSRR